MVQLIAASPVMKAIPGKVEDPSLGIRIAVIRIPSEEEVVLDLPPGAVDSLLTAEKISTKLSLRFQCWQQWPICPAGDRMYGASEVVYRRFGTSNPGGL